MTLQNVAPPEFSPDLAAMFISRALGNTKDYSKPNPLVFMNMLKEGIPGATIKTLIQIIPKSLVLDAVGTDASNFSKLVKKKRLSQKQTEELNDLTSLWLELRQFFQDDNELISEWISSPSPVLEGATPLSLMSSQYGRGVIKELIDEMKYGDFS